MVQHGVGRGVGGAVGGGGGDARVAVRLNTLGLGPRELHAVLDFLDEQDRGGGSVRREFSRWAYRATSVRVSLEHPGGTATTLYMAGRNLSRGGASLLHNTFVHSGTRCEVELPRVGMRPLVVQGTVVRCQHRRGVLHEVGVRFAKPVDMRQFAAPPAGQELLSMEKVDPTTLRGRVLVLEDSDLDVRMVRHFLRETSLELTVCGTLAEARAQENARFDLYLVDQDLPDGKGTEFVSGLLKAQTSAPILMMTGDAMEAIDSEVLEASCIGVIQKPYEQDDLLRTIAERMIVLRAAPAKGTKQGLAATPEQILALADRLDAARTKGDLGEARSAAMDVAGLAGFAGLAPLAFAGRLALDVLRTVPALREDEPLLVQLAASCRAAARAA